MEHGALLTAIFGCDDGDPTGDANAGDGKKCGSDACIDVKVVGCGKDIGACIGALVGGSRALSADSQR